MKKGDKLIATSPTNLPDNILKEQRTNYFFFLLGVTLGLASSFLFSLRITITAYIAVKSTPESTAFNSASV